MIVAAAGACGSSTSMDQSWTTPQPTHRLSNLVTVYVSHDGALRRSAEDAMAVRLASEGVHAVPAYAILPNEDMTDQQAVRTKLIGKGYDGVVAIRLLSANTQIQANPTFVGYWGGAWAYNDSWLYTQTVVRVETNVYSLPENRLVWSALSSTLDPSSTHAAVKSVTKFVAKRLENQGIVATRQSTATYGT